MYFQICRQNVSMHSYTVASTSRSSMLKITNAGIAYMDTLILNYTPAGQNSHHMTCKYRTDLAETSKTWENDHHKTLAICRHCTLKSVTGTFFPNKSKIF